MALSGRGLPRAALERSGGPQGNPAFDALRRRLYLHICAVGIGVELAIWGLNEGKEVPDLVTRSASPVLLAVTCGIWLWLRAGRSIATVERLGVAVCTVMILARLLTLPLLDPRHILYSLEDLYWLLVAMSFVNFVVFDYRRAIAASALMYLLAVTLPWAVLESTGFTEGLRLAQMQLLCGMVMLFSCILAWYREHFILMRDRAELSERLANTDALTGLSNRHALYPQLEALLRQRTKLQETHPSALLLLDIDHFKRVNDRFGHNTGDEVLRTVAQVLRSELREPSLLGRWGGEEFLIGLPETGSDGALAVAERLRQAVGTHNFAGVGRLTISLGVAVCQRGDSSASCVARADAALYQAKQRGRNQTVVAGAREPVGREKTGLEASGPSGRRAGW